MTVIAFTNSRTAAGPHLDSGSNRTASWAHTMAGIVTATALLLPNSALAYKLAGYQWPAAHTEFQANLTGSSPSGQSWQDAFVRAGDAWSADSAFEFDFSELTADPCHSPSSGDTVNGVDFRSSRCDGSAFSSRTLAVTISWSVRGELIQAGIVFNDADHVWDVYDGPWQGSNRADFSRVAVHELGHALGLGHESEETAIMAPHAGDLTMPQADDVEGVGSLYAPEPIFVSRFEVDTTAKSAIASVGAERNHESAVSADWRHVADADVDGDGETDRIRYRAIDGLWQVNLSGGGRLQRRLGGPGQKPLVEDLNRDGRADLATWTPATGEGRALMSNY